MTLRTLNGEVLQGWRRELTDNGVPYYISTTHESSQWYHPEYVLLLQRTIQRYKGTRYTAYRTAQKLAYLQDALAIGGVSIQSLVAAWASVGLSSNDSNDDSITVEVMQALLDTLYYSDSSSSEEREAAHQKCNKKAAAAAAGSSKRQCEQQTASAAAIISNTKEEECKAVCVELLLNLLLNLFDQSRDGLLPVLGCKLLLLLLCGAWSPLQQKHCYLYTQLAAYNSAVSRKSVHRALQLMSRLPEVVGEELWFGRHLVKPTVQACFQGQLSSSVGLSQSELCSWLRREPQTLVWWSTLYRLRYAAAVCHSGVGCSACKAQSPCGLLYVCLHCINYTLCQHCFLSACCTPPHTASHPVQEYCTQVSMRDRGREVLSRLSERLKLQGKPSDRQRYLPIAQCDLKEEQVSSPSRATTVSAGDAEAHSLCVPHALPGEELSTHDKDGAEELLSRTISLAPPSTGQCSEESRLNIQPHRRSENLYVENPVHGKVIPKDAILEQQKQSDGLKSSASSGSKSHGDNDKINHLSEAEEVLYQNPKKNKKKSLLNLLFKGGKGKSKKVKTDLSNKENMIEMAEDDLGHGAGFSRFYAKSRSFGADGTSKALAANFNGVRYGSYRMNQPYVGNQRTSKSANAASTSVTGKGLKPEVNVAAGTSAACSTRLADATELKIGSSAGTSEAARLGNPGFVASGSSAAGKKFANDTLLRMERDNTNNLEQHQQLGIAGDGSPRRQVSRIIQQLQDGYSALTDISLSGSHHSTAVVQQHAKQLNQHIAALKQLMQTLNNPVGVVPPRPRSFAPGRHIRIPSFESSTPISGFPGRLALPLRRDAPLTSHNAPPTSCVAPPASFVAPPVHGNKAKLPFKDIVTDHGNKTQMNRENVNKYTPKSTGISDGKRENDTHRDGDDICDDADKGRPSSWSSLSPITCSSSQHHHQASAMLDDTAAHDNKQNHQVENPTYDAGGVFKVPSAVRNGSSNKSKQNNTDSYTSARPQDGSVVTVRQDTFLSVQQRSRLPSFTEVNFSDLTGFSTQSGVVSSRFADNDTITKRGWNQGRAKASAATTTSKKASNHEAGGAACSDRYSEQYEDDLKSSEDCGDATFVGAEAETDAALRDSIKPADDTGALNRSCLELQQELEDILQQLDAMFPVASNTKTTATSECAGVVCAAQELGDCLAEYVSAVPSATADGAAADGAAAAADDSTYIEV